MTDKITYQEFLKKHKRGEVEIFVNKNKAGHFVLSEYASRYNKPAHQFWTWAGIVLVLPLPIVLLFINWPVAIPVFVFGLMVSSGARKSAIQFVIQNMLDDEKFWHYVLLNKGAILRNKEGKEIPLNFR